MNKQQKIFSILILIAIFSYSYFTFPVKQIIKENTKINDSIITDSIYEFILLLDIKHPKIVYNQAKLETGNFTSNRFIKHNALFGFQTSDTDIIKYKSWKESVIDYKCWQMKRLKNNEDYYKFLIKIGYAQDSLYINKLKQFKND